MARTIVDLHNALLDAGIPIEGVAGTQGNIRVDFLPGATQQQRAAAQTVVADFDWRDREPKAINGLVTEIQGLNQAQQNKLFAAIAAEFLQRNPDFAAKLGINVSGSQVKPKAKP